MKVLVVRVGDFIRMLQDFQPVILQFYSPWWSGEEKSPEEIGIYLFCVYALRC